MYTNKTQNLTHVRMLMHYKCKFTYVLLPQTSHITRTHTDDPAKKKKTKQKKHKKMQKSTFLQKKKNTNKKF